MLTFPTETIVTSMFNASTASRMQMLRIIEFVGYLINRKPTSRAHQSVVETTLVFTSKRFVWLTVPSNFEHQKACGPNQIVLGSQPTTKKRIGDLKPILRTSHNGSIQSNNFECSTEILNIFCISQNLHDLK